MVIIRDNLPKICKKTVEFTTNINFFFKFKKIYDLF